MDGGPGLTLCSLSAASIEVTNRSSSGPTSFSSDQCGTVGGASGREVLLEADTRKALLESPERGVGVEGSLGRLSSSSTGAFSSSSEPGHSFDSSSAYQLFEGLIATLRRFA